MTGFTDSRGGMLTHHLLCSRRVPVGICHRDGDLAALGASRLPRLAAVDPRRNGGVGLRRCHVHGARSNGGNGGREGGSGVDKGLRVTADGAVGTGFVDQAGTNGGRHEGDERAQGNPSVKCAPASHLAPPITPSPVVFRGGFC